MEVDRRSVGHKAVAGLVRMAVAIVEEGPESDRVQEVVARTGAVRIEVVHIHTRVAAAWEELAVPLAGHRTEHRKRHSAARTQPWHQEPS